MHTTRLRTCLDRFFKEEITSVDQGEYEYIQNILHYLKIYYDVKITFNVEISLGELLKHQSVEIYIYVPKNEISVYKF